MKKGMKMEKVTIDLYVSDIHSYTVFANIDDREGNIRGHMLILSKEQIDKIEDIVLSEKVIAVENYIYEVE